MDHFLFNGTPKERALKSELYNAIISDDILKFQSIHDSFNCDYDCFYYAIVNGSLDIVKYLMVIRYPLSQNACYINVAVMSSNLLLIKFLHEEGFVWNKDTFSIAVGTSSIKTLKYLYDNGCPISENIYCGAISNNRHNIVVFLHRLGIPWKNEELKLALEKGNEFIIRYILENDYVVTNEKVPPCSSLELTKYLVSKGLKLTSENMLIAIDLNDIYYIRYLCERKCEVNHECIARAMKKRDPTIIGLLVGNGHL